MKIHITLIIFFIVLTVLQLTAIIAWPWWIIAIPLWPLALAFGWVLVAVLVEVFKTILNKG